MKRVIGVMILGVLVLGQVFTYGAGTSAVWAEEREAENEEPESEDAESGEAEEPDTSAGVEIESPSAILVEASTGQVIYEKGADERRSPASVTKVMTLLLIYEALEAGTLKMDDSVVTSANAKSMGGSQVFLEEGEIQDVETMIKCIVIASGNDAAVAMAEHVAGSEEEFVRLMNERAAQLGMDNTNFEDCCGLTESENHYTTARDISIMSRELITRFPQITDYTTIWMEDITHETKQGTSDFTLTNTNKLLRTYEGITGLKTGSTSVAKYCFAGTAKRGDIELVSVVMAAPDYKVRFNDAARMLDYGFAKCNLFRDDNQDQLENLPVRKGVEDEVAVRYAGEFTYLDLDGNALDGVEKEIQLPEEIQAPVKAGDTAGKVVYMLNGNEIGSVDILYESDVTEAGFKDYLLEIIGKLSV